MDHVIIYRSLQETRRYFFYLWQQQYSLSFINVGLIYDNVIPSERDYSLAITFLLLVETKIVSTLGKSTTRLETKTCLAAFSLCTSARAGGETIDPFSPRDANHVKTNDGKPGVSAASQQHAVVMPIQSLFSLRTRSLGGELFPSFALQLRHPVDRTISWYRALLAKCPTE
jgi:hypothetical protein